MLFFALLWFIECYWSPAQVASMYSVLLGRYFRVTKFSRPASILMISTFKHWSAVNLIVSMTRCTDWWWTPESCIPLWKPELLTVSVFQGPEEATLPKMKAQHMQFTLKRYQYLSIFLTCLGFLHILPPTFVVYCWHTTYGWFWYNQHVFQPQYMSQFAYMGHCGYMMSMRRAEYRQDFFSLKRKGRLQSKKESVGNSAMLFLEDVSNSSDSNEKTFCW